MEAHMTKDPMKEALQRMPYGFYSITSRNGEEVNAMVGNWLTQVSYEPRLLLFGLAKSAYSHLLIAAGGVFAVNIFNQEDSDHIKHFTKSRAKKPDKMEGVAWTPAPETGCPMLDGAAAVIECRVEQLIDVGGDHDLLLGRVVNAVILKPGDEHTSLTLPYMGWNYAG
jgi:flavin reductase (DIM6/NTAB) family NADH-FMN oxidoreductase RutF